jgi:hypothetical protein
MLSFELPDPTKKPLLEMELHLKWPDGSVGPTAARKPPSVANPVSTESRTVEEYLERLPSSPDSGSELPSISSAPVAKTTSKVQLPIPYPINQLPAVLQTPVSSDRVTFSIVPDPEQERQDADFFSALCKKYKNNPQGIPPGACAAWLSQHKQ